MMESAATFLTFLGTLVTNLLGWLGNVATFVMEQPLILVPTLVFFIGGGCVAIWNRFVRG